MELRKLIAWAITIFALPGLVLLCGYMIAGSLLGALAFMGLMCITLGVIGVIVLILIWALSELNRI